MRGVEETDTRVVASPNTKSLIFVLVSSFVISGAILFLPHAFHYDPALSIALLSTYALAGIWFGLFIFAVLRWRRRALWLLVGSPPVLMVIYNFLGITVGCALGYGCL